MRHFAIALLLASSPVLFAGDVVEAARSAKEQRKKSTTKVITNADVAKAKGKLSESSVETAPIGSDETLSPLEQQRADNRAREANERRLAALQVSIEALEKQIAAIEQSYYEEDDLERRDRDLVRRFEEAKARLDVLQAELKALTPEKRDPVVVRGTP